MGTSVDEYTQQRCQELEHELEVSEKHRITLAGVIESERAAWRREFDWKIEAEQLHRDSERKVLRVLAEKEALEGGIVAEARRTTQEIDRLKAELDLAQEHVDTFHLATCYAEEPCAECAAARERQLCREALAALAGDPPPAESLYSQVERLAQFIMSEVPGEPSASQGAVDTAIRIIRKLQGGDAHGSGGQCCSTSDRKVAPPADENCAPFSRRIVGAGAFRGLRLWSREELGQLVRTEWIAWALEQPNPKASWLQSWDELTEPEREVDRRIGEAVACLVRMRAFARVNEEWRRASVTRSDEDTVLSDELEHGLYFP